MKSLKQYIYENDFHKSELFEKLLINKNYNDGYNYHPKDKKELKAAIQEHYDNDIYNLNDIDVFNITDFSYVFNYDENTGNKDFDISEWNVSNGINFLGMFNNCHKFNCNLSNWDVSNGEDFTWMFYGCIDFNHDLSGWKINKTAITNAMFLYCNIDNKYKPKGVE